MPPPRRPRELVPRDRDVLLRERELVARGFDAVVRGFDAVLREDFEAPLVARFAVELFAGDLRAVDAVADFPRVEVALPALERVPLVREVEPAEREDAGFVVRFADERVPDDFFVPLLRAALPRDEEDDELPLLAEPSIDHLPDITRCAASATASAMIEPSLVALEATALAACDAVSAASSPASRIFLRAAGLALIAAAAAANPAASISLLIAAFASLSTVSFEVDRDELERGEDEREPEDVEREELLRVDFAIFYLPPCRQRHFKAVPVP